MSILKKIFTDKFNRYFFLYLFRVLIGFAVGFSLMEAYPAHGLFWTLLSIILVISPEEKDTPRLTIERVISNLIGAASGLAVMFIDIQYIAKVISGIVLAVVICKLFNLMNVVRSSVVALLIILLEHSDSLLSPFERFLSVAFGCLIGLAITLLTGWIVKSIWREK